MPRSRRRRPPEPDLLTGRNSVLEMLRAGRRQVGRVLVAEGGSSQPEIVALCRKAGVRIDVVHRRELDALGTTHHQGVAAQVSDYPYAELHDIVALAERRSEVPFVLALDTLEDPQNVGTLLRTAEAVGVHGIVLPERRAAQITPAVSRASAGAVEHLLVAKATNLVRALQVLKDSGLWVVGVEQHPQAVHYREADLGMPLVLVLASEGRGMRRLVAETCDLFVYLPMHGRIGSLNVSVAGSVALYQALAVRERGARSSTDAADTPSV